MKSPNPNPINQTKTSLAVLAHRSAGLGLSRYLHVQDGLTIDCRVSLLPICAIDQQPWTLRMGISRSVRTSVEGKNLQSAFYVFRYFSQNYETLFCRILAFFQHDRGVRTFARCFLNLYSVDQSNRSTQSDFRGWVLLPRSPCTDPDPDRLEAGEVSAPRHDHQATWMVRGVTLYP